VGSDTFLATLTHLSTQAQTERPKLSRQHERATATFVARVLAFTAVTLVGWLWYDPSRALEATIALLVVACPCALGLAAPAAITRALGVLARRSILIIHPDALDTLTRINHAVFDKTGTLTQPSLDLEGTDPSALQLAASLARESQHPLSRALVAANKQPLLAVEQVKSFPGMGLEGVIQGRTLRLGQPSFVLDEQSTIALPDANLVLGEKGQVLACFNMHEDLKEDAAATLATLRREKIACEILSGDSPQRVEQVAQELPDTDWRARQLPTDKLNRLRQLHEQKQRVMAVGDGSNDAPVLAGADISVAIASGAELAQANADVLLCSGQLSGLLQARAIARETQRILQQNQRWAITYNTLAMPLAALGFIPPWLAAICMSASSLIVVLNALRIGRTQAPPPKVAHCCEKASS
jgi:Cu2+-exporting ATPase